MATTPLASGQTPSGARRAAAGPHPPGSTGRTGSPAPPYDGAPAGAWLQHINALLKRLCRNHYPGANSHTLNGRQWLAFLDNRCPAAGLTRWMVLVEGAYKPECKLDDKAIAGLAQAVEIWIRKHV